MHDPSVLLVIMFGEENSMDVEIGGEVEGNTIGSTLIIGLGMFAES